MTIYIPFKKVHVKVKVEGDGQPVMLLHGYLENLNIWDDFARRLEPHYLVIRMDIPGHGETDVVAAVHTMSLMAEAVDTVLKHLAIHQCVLAGHSMGGYVALAYLAEHAKRVAGICLFHSSPVADSDKQRAARRREIRLVEADKLSLICNASIPNGFADENLLRLADKIAIARQIACETPPEGAIAILEGMRQRPDRCDLLRQSTLPLLFILGKKDHYITFEETYSVARSLPCATVRVLEYSGHSGYTEEPEQSMEYILSFLKECYPDTVPKIEKE